MLNKTLTLSFTQHLGERGCHFYDDHECRFLDWKEVLTFIHNYEQEGEDPFSEKLTETLANYNPDIQFLAVKQTAKRVAVELYTKPDHDLDEY